MANEKFNLNDYVPVHERLAKFYDLYPDGRILTSIVHHDLESGFVMMRAEAYRVAGDNLPASTGHAYEQRGEGYINKTSHVENCETSAIGRALANLGLEIKRGIASREEMEKVQRMQNAVSTRQLSEKARKDAVAEILNHFAPNTDEAKMEKMAGKLRGMSDDEVVAAVEKVRKAAA